MSSVGWLVSAHEDVIKKNISMHEIVQRFSNSLTPTRCMTCDTQSGSERYPFCYSYQKLHTVKIVFFEKKIKNI